MTNAFELARDLIGQGTARSHELEAAGVARSQLSRLVVSGQLVRVARGLYALPGREPASDEALVIVVKRVPEAIFCLLTALRLHRLTTQAPHEVWIAIGHKDRAPRLDWPPLRVVRFSGSSLEAGIETRVVDNVPVKLTSIARTVADCFKFRNKIGVDVAMEALREARRSRVTSMDELWHFAHICRVANVMRPYLEALS
ncbi:type IV toxin-antitoxin system AbiEi family antitoxin domain-containing protein [Lysobacter sp. GX 14042]|uniref:type IV toxin-antitoxin system AbiEi family antitoxin domain-containing protein n=1 Tax=Lysobacter sp. GX 14042 TaxID=2907155 RepID=UPI001F1C5072|nr:type IV toxin-antitoxin system AbiEi family antitoxin domain-containing protein [Lysobacter sp. GX 14042]MCE7032836.1 type IV toxin-antitoxin system AbiEi family antitoxin domain-containing protein [Lysobacter sp. GX 14042]